MNKPLEMRKKNPKIDCKKTLIFDRGINGHAIDYLSIEWQKFVFLNDTHLVGVPVKINGSKALDFVLDTGAGGTVITQHLAEKLELTTQPFPGIVKRSPKSFSWRTEKIFLSFQGEQEAV